MPTRQECVSDFDIVTPIVALWCIVLLLRALYLVYRMRHLRKQFHEYFLIRRVAVLVVLAPTLFIFITSVTGPEHGALRRRMLVVLTILITGLLFWIPIYKPVWAFITKDEASGELHMTPRHARKACQGMFPSTTLPTLALDGRVESAGGTGALTRWLLVSLRALEVTVYSHEYP